MSPAAQRFVSRVREVLDEADEVGGIEDLPDYVEMMTAIAEHAAKRAKTAAADVDPVGVSS